MSEGAPQDPIGFDISQLHAEARKTVLDQAVARRDEKWAAEALAADQPFSKEEQQTLIELIREPNSAFEVLTSCAYTSRVFTADQEEILFELIAKDPEIVEMFYDTFVESGVIENPNETELRWIKRLEQIQSEE